MAVDHQALWEKSKILIERALEARDQQRDDDYQLWAALCLEVLGKARLAKLHPALVVDPQDHEGLLAVCGGPPTSEVRTVSAKTVFSRCHKTVLGFDNSRLEFCTKLANDRNAYLHSGAVPFAARRPDAWQSAYWGVVELFVTAQGRSLEDLVGPDEAAAARIIIADAKRTRGVHVQRRIASHAHDFRALTNDERGFRAAAARILETQLKQDGYSMRKAHSCPSCGNPGALDGNVIGEAEAMLLAEEPWLRRINCTVASESFRCTACGLKLDGTDEIMLAGLPHEYEKFIIREEDEGDPYGND